MEEIFKIISEHPQYFAWAFGLINTLWIAFVYFNKKRHERELIEVQQSFDLDLERRKKIFEMKVTQYEAYFRQIDAIHQRHQTDYQDVVVPLMNQFFSSYLEAASRNDGAAQTQATIKLTEQISKITRDGMQEAAVIKAETNSLRLTASDEVAFLLDEVATIYSALFEAANKAISDTVKITLNNDQELASKNQQELYRLGELAKSKAAALREQMRNDLKQI